MKRLPVFLSLFATLVLLCPSVGAGAKKWDDESGSRKADYVFIEAQNAYGNEDYSTFFTLMKRAYELDSSDIDIAGEWGMIELSLGTSDTAQANHAYQLMRRRYLADPSSYTNGAIFANAASQLRRFDDVVMVWETLDSIYPAKQEAAETLANAYVIKAIVGDTTALDRALAIYHRLESGTGKDVALSSQIIRAHMLRNDTTAAESELADLMRHSPTDSYTALFTGSTFEYLQRPDSALKYYSLACALDSANGRAYMARANFYRNRGDSVAFDREVFHALNSSDLEVDTKIEMLRSYVSDLYMDSTQRPRISALFDHLQQLHPGVPEIHALNAAYLYQIDRPADGAEQMMYATALDPENEAYHSSYVQMLAVAGDNDRMLDEAAMAQKKFPDNLYFPIARASVLHQKELIDSALAVMNSVNIETVSNPDAVSNFLGYKADLTAAKGDTLAALQTYERAISLNPDNIGALNNAAYFMAVSGGDLDKAERYSSRAIKAEPENATYLDTYAWILFKQKNLSLARQYIDATIRVYEEEIKENADNPDYRLSPDIYEHAGDIYFMDGNPAEALEFWKKALDIDPKSDILRRKVQHKTYFYQ